MGCESGTAGTAYPILLTDAVVEHAGHQHLRGRDGRLRPLLDGQGLAVVNFVPGWTPGVLFGAAAPFLMLEFSGPDGARAAWLLDAGLCRLGRPDRRGWSRTAYLN